jgi:hypothetical protein
MRRCPSGGAANRPATEAANDFGTAGSPKLPLDGRRGGD